VVEDSPLFSIDEGPQLIGIEMEANLGQVGELGLIEMASGEQPLTGVAGGSYLL